MSRPAPIPRLLPLPSTAVLQRVHGSPLSDLSFRIQKAIGRVAVVADCAHSLGASRVVDGEKKYCGAIANFSSFSLEITCSGKFKRDYRLMKKRGYDMELLKDLVEQLKIGKPLDEKYHDHQLIADFAGSRECHIRPDGLLIYWKGKDYIELQRTGTHSDLF